MRRGEQRVGGTRMRGAISERGGRAVTRQFIEEKFGVARGVRGIGEFLLLDEGVFLQPFEQLRAVGRDHLGLREMDVRVDESRQDQGVGENLHRYAGRQPRRDVVRRPDRFDPAVFHQDDAVFDEAIALRVAGAGRRPQEGQKPAADRAHTQLRRLVIAPARPRQARRRVRDARRSSCP